MRNFILISIMFFAIIANAQTPFTMVSAKEKTSAISANRVASLNNAWIGAKLAYNVSGDVSNSIIVSGRAMYMAAAGNNYGIPILTNISLNNADTLYDDGGLSIGIYPFYSLVGSDNFKLLLHSGLQYAILDNKDVDTRTQFKMLFGLEAAFYPENNKQPFTLSIAPEYTLAIQDVNTNTFGIGITGVLPIATGLGILFDGSIPLDNSAYKGLQIGVIVNTDIK